MQAEVLPDPTAPKIAGRVGGIDTLAVQAPNARAEAHADPRESEGGERRRGRRPAGFCQEQTDVILVHTEPSMTTPLFSRAQRVREVPLTVADRTEVEKCRRSHNRLRFSYQVGA